MEISDIDVHLDVSDIGCPQALIKTKLALNAMQIGQKLCVKAGDRKSVQDVLRVVAKKKYKLVKQVESDHLILLTIQK